MRDWKALGVPFSRPDSVYTSTAGLLAQPGIDGAWVLSMGYLYSWAIFREGLELDDAAEYRGVRRENDYVAAEVRRAPDRLVGFCGVNPLRPYADAELLRCRDTLGLRGVKLHLANTGLDPHAPDQVARAAAIAAWAEAGGQPMLLHFDPMRSGLEVADLEPLLERVIDAHPRLDLVIAHLGGSGGYGEWTRAVAPAIARRISGRPGRLVLDLSATILERESEGVPATTAAEAAAFAEDLRRIGFGNVVFGSDYPVFDPIAYRTTLRTRVPLTPVELDSIFANRPFAVTP
ncbi:MAG: amidohydrolase family protein [Gemmatimonadales bacterium]